MKRLLSTKILTTPQKAPLLAAGYIVDEYDAITTKALDFELHSNADYFIFTSQNAVKAYLEKIEDHLDHTPKPVCCVGSKTGALLEENGLEVLKIAENAEELAGYISKNHPNDSFLFFCGKRRLATLSVVLRDAAIPLEEIEVYDTILQPIQFPQEFDGILFFSPSGVESFCKSNDLHNRYAYCIGPTTAGTARLFTNHICIADEPTVEGVVKAVLHNSPAPEQ